MLISKTSTRRIAYSGRKENAHCYGRRTYWWFINEGTSPWRIHQLTRHIVSFFYIEKVTVEKSFDLFVTFVQTHPLPMAIACHIKRAFFLLMMTRSKSLASFRMPMTSVNIATRSISQYKETCLKVSSKNNKKHIIMNNENIFQALGIFLDAMRPFLVSVLQTTSPVSRGRCLLSAFDRTKTRSIGNAQRQGVEPMLRIDYHNLTFLASKFRDELAEELGNDKSKTFILKVQ